MDSPSELYPLEIPLKSTFGEDLKRRQRGSDVVAPGRSKQSTCEGHVAVGNRTS